MTSRFIKRTVIVLTRCAVGCGACAAVGCDSFELPDPPNVSGLVQAYEYPSGRLDQQTVAGLALALVDRVEAARERVPIELTDELVGDVAQVGDDHTDFEEEAGVQTIMGNRIDVAAVTRISHTCRGWEGQDRVDRERNGSLELTLTVDRTGMIPTSWGHFERCRFSRGDVLIELDGELAIHFGVHQRRLGLREVRVVPYLFSFDGMLIVQRGDQRIEVDTSFDFRVLPGGDVQLSVNMPDGTNVVGVLNPAAMLPGYSEPSLRAGILTRDQNWQCDLSRNRGSCANEANAGEVVRW